MKYNNRDRTVQTIFGESDKGDADTYASEADLLNMALFGKTAKQWRTENSDKKRNIRDHATLNQLLVLANMESYGAILIEQGKEQSESQNENYYKAKSEGEK